MIIRRLEEKDLETVSAICMSAFLHSVAGTLTAEGVATFSKICLIKFSLISPHQFSEKPTKSRR